MGGISRTIVRDGFRFDLGGHRFFTKDDEINDFFRRILGDEIIWVPRSSKIYYLNKYFRLPLEADKCAARDGRGHPAKCLADYGYVKVRNLFSQRRSSPSRIGSAMEFGRELFRLFFKNYTEKVWASIAT